MVFVKGNCWHMHTLLLCQLVLLVVHSSAEFNLTIVHTNDVHARFVQTNKYGSPCSNSTEAKGGCVGGVARRMTKVKEIRNNETNVLFMDGGDQFQGTPWFTHYKGNATKFFVQKLGYDVMALGNHEFDNGVEGLYPYLTNIGIPFVCANLDITNEKRLQGLFTPSVLLDVNGVKVAVVGFITGELPVLVKPSATENIEIKNVVDALQQEVDRLKSQGHNKIIALGHAGYPVDKEIAKKVRGLDLVVGGHTNAFLYSGEPPSNDDPVGPYPTVVRSDDGRDVLVVQDFTYGKYLGNLQVTFDDNDEITHWEGNPILLDSSVEQDQEILTLVDQWKGPIDEFDNTIFGKSLITLDGEKTSCRRTNCMMGNFITDNIVRRYLHYRGPGPWADASVVLLNSGNIRGSIQQGDVSLSDILLVLPYNNAITRLKLSGKTLREALEHSVDVYNKDDSGQFLQFSGLKVKYNVKKNPGSRVVDVQVLCHDCDIPKYEPLDDNRVYPVFTNEFMSNGGDGYDMLRDDHLGEIYNGDILYDVISSQITTYSNGAYGILDDRIIFVDDKDNMLTCSATRFLPFYFILLLQLSCTLLLSNQII